MTDGEDDNERRNSGDDDYTIESEWNRASRALRTARDALQNLALLWERGKADAASNLADAVTQVIEGLEATIG